MDLQWLLPEQIEQILKLCDLSSIQDPTLAANILEQHHWNLEFALHDLVQQNDDIHQIQHPKLPQPAPKKESAWKPAKEEYGFQHEEEEFEVDESLYHQLDQKEAQPQQQHRNLLAQQNQEYEAMEKSYIAKLAEQEELSQYQQLKDREFSEHREEFASHKAERPIQIKFRLASRVHLFAFDLADQVQKVFKYVSGHFREDFDNKYADFDLTQAFPAVSLRDKQEQTLEQVFGESSGEVLIVREL